MSAQEKLILIDGHALVHRAFHAIRAPMTAKDGTPTNALFGFVSMFLKLISVQKPTHLIACFDVKGKTFRHEDFPEYKATRAKTDPSLHEQVPLVKKFLEAWCVPIFEMQGWEADDLLGTLAKQAEAEKVPCVIFTGDRDLTQMISDLIEVDTPLNGGDLKKWGRDEVKEYFGVEPDQVVDFKALAGDSSDNIPGVQGIGPKGASDLLNEFGTLEGIFENLEKVKESVRKKLEEKKEEAFMSQKLAKIRCDAPVTLSLEMGKEECDLTKVDEFFEEIGFRTLRNRFREQMGMEKLEGLQKTKKKKVDDSQMSLF